VKPDNFLIDKKTGIVKVCDLGSSRLITNKRAMVSYLGTRYFRAPELILNSTALTYAIDIWSLGVTLAGF